MPILLIESENITKNTIRAKLNKILRLKRIKLSILTKLTKI